MNDDCLSDAQLVEKLIATVDSIDLQTTTYGRWHEIVESENSEFFRRYRAPEASSIIKMGHTDAMARAVDDGVANMPLFVTKDDYIRRSYSVDRNEAERLVGNVRDNLERIKSERESDLDADRFEEDAWLLKGMVAEDDWEAVYAQLKNLHQKYFSKK